MPGIVQVQVSRARNLPIMDKSSELTDAFAEVRPSVHLSSGILHTPYHFTISCDVHNCSEFCIFTFR